MSAQRILILCLLATPLVQARTSINYLVRITNKTNRAFKLHCNNHYYRPIIMGNSNEFTMSGVDVPDTPQTQYEQRIRELNNLLMGWGQRDTWDRRANGLYTQKTILQNELFNEKRSDYYEAKLQQIREIDRKIQAIVTELRPVIAPKSVMDTSCRIFSPVDKPKNHANVTTDFAKSKDETWQPIPTVLRSGDYTITVIDDNERGKCPEGYLLLRAESSTGQKTSACIQNSVDASKVNLVITDNGIELREARFGIVEPIEQGLRYMLPGEHYHATQGDYSEPPARLHDQVDAFTKAE